MDQQLFNLIHGFADRSQLLDFLGIFLADYLGYFLIVAAVYLIWRENNWQKRFQGIAFLSLSLLLSRGILTELIRFFYYRPRPFLVLDFTPLIAETNKGAFPSGHAAFYFALAGTLFFLNRRNGWYFGLGALAIGFGRIFVGVHWPLDILAGALVAAISAYAVNLLLTKLPFIKESD